MFVPDVIDKTIKKHDTAHTTEPPGHKPLAVNTHTTVPPGHKLLVVNMVIVGQFEEEEKGFSDIVKVKGADPETPDYLRGDRVRGDEGDLGS